MSPIFLLLLGSVFAVLSDPIPDPDSFRVTADKDAGDYLRNLLLRDRSTYKPVRPALVAYPPAYPFIAPPYWANYLRAYPHYGYVEPVHHPYHYAIQPAEEKKSESAMVIDESSSDQEAIAQLLAWKEENDRQDQESRFLLPSITINSTTITITRTSFLSLLSSLTVSITTRTILVPGLSIG